MLLFLPMELWRRSFVTREYQRDFVMYLNSEIKIAHWRGISQQSESRTNPTRASTDFWSVLNSECCGSNPNLQTAHTIISAALIKLAKCIMTPYARCWVRWRNTVWQLLGSRSSEGRGWRQRENRLPCRNFFNTTEMYTYMGGNSTLLFCTALLHLCVHICSFRNVFSIADNLPVLPSPPRGSVSWQSSAISTRPSAECVKLHESEIQSLNFGGQRLWICNQNDLWKHSIRKPFLLGFAQYSLQYLSFHFFLSSFFLFFRAVFLGLFFVSFFVSLFFFFLHFCYFAI